MPDVENKDGTIIDPAENNDKKDLKEGDEGYVAPTGDDKKTETPQERVARLQGMLKRAKTDAGIEDEPVVEKKSSKKSEDLDYGQKAFLIANGIKEADEIKAVQEFMANTGKSLDDAISSKYLQAELKDMRDAKIAMDATPNGSKRSGQSAQSTVEYWIAKGELPPASERELRTKVVNARLKKESQGNVFTDNPVVR